MERVVFCITRFFYRTVIKKPAIPHMVFEAQRADTVCRKNTPSVSKGVALTPP